RAAGSVSFMTDVCARTELGSLSAQESGDAQSARKRLWASAGGILRGRVAVGRGGVRPYLEVDAGLLAPLVRDHFHFASGDPVTAPPLQWTLLLHAGLVIW
ncbi:MAG TPA: hypothetical protein VLT33_21055, partial [Labilithrix sp.]|nr:hypothetical protein [Labilithrix sp.]